MRIGANLSTRLNVATVNVPRLTRLNLMDLRFFETNRRERALSLFTPAALIMAL